MTPSASKAIASCFALAAFAVAVLAGLAGGNSASSIMLRALLSMIACYPLGLLIGVVCRHVVEQHVRQGAAQKEGAAEQNAENAEESEDAVVV
jgi:hypothetical protein